MKEVGEVGSRAGLAVFDKQNASPSMYVQVQLVGRSGVVLDWQDAEISTPHEYQDLIRPWGRRAVDGQTTRTVSDDSPHYVKWWTPRPELA